MERSTAVGLETKGRGDHHPAGYSYKAHMGRVKSRQNQQVPRLTEIQVGLWREAPCPATASHVTHPVSSRRESNLQVVELL